ncbi:unnamed protein product [Moneuplotes crassus]|uniref:Uncharacterized protein n=1 Tax=Euplotes crassus TaxID=5936 RepID=A0AAD1X938_EUPCR|nr:unnamed protein product [Moneuplotes crassus]
MSRPKHFKIIKEIKSLEQRLITIKSEMNKLSDTSYPKSTNKESLHNNNIAFTKKKKKMKILPDINKNHPARSHVNRSVNLGTLKVPNQILKRRNQLSKGSNRNPNRSIDVREGLENTPLKEFKQNKFHSKKTSIFDNKKAKDINLKGSNGRDSMITQKPEKAPMKTSQKFFSGVDDERQYIPLKERRRRPRNKRRLDPIHSSIEPKPISKIIENNISIIQRRETRNKEMAVAYNCSDEFLESLKSLQRQGVKLKKPETLMHIKKTNKRKNKRRSSIQFDPVKTQTLSINLKNLSQTIKKKARSKSRNGHSSAFQDKSSAKSESHEENKGSLKSQQKNHKKPIQPDKKLEPSLILTKILDTRVLAKEGKRQMKVKMSFQNKKQPSLEISSKGKSPIPGTKKKTIPAERYSPLNKHLNTEDVIKSEYIANLKNVSKSPSPTKITKLSSKKIPPKEKEVRLPNENTEEFNSMKEIPQTKEAIQKILPHNKRTSMNLELYKNQMEKVFCVNNSHRGTPDSFIDCSKFKEKCKKLCTARFKDTEEAKDSLAENSKIIPETPPNVDESQSTEKRDFKSVEPSEGHGSLHRSGTQTREKVKSNISSYCNKEEKNPKMQELTFCKAKEEEKQDKNSDKHNLESKDSSLYNTNLNAKEIMSNYQSDSFFNTSRDPNSRLQLVNKENTKDNEKKSVSSPEKSPKNGTPEEEYPKSSNEEILKPKITLNNGGKDVPQDISKEEVKASPGAILEINNGNTEEQDASVDISQKSMTIKNSTEVHLNNTADGKNNFNNSVEDSLQQQESLVNDQASNSKEMLSSTIQKFDKFSSVSSALEENMNVQELPKGNAPTVHISLKADKNPLGLSAPLNDAAALKNQQENKMLIKMNSIESKNSLIVPRTNSQSVPGNNSNVPRSSKSIWTFYNSKEGSVINENEEIEIMSNVPSFNGEYNYGIKESEINQEESRDKVFEQYFGGLQESPQRDSSGTCTKNESSQKIPLVRSKTADFNAKKTERYDTSVSPTEREQASCIRVRLVEPRSIIPSWPVFKSK